jgi:hypothetical protein
MCACLCLRSDTHTRNAYQWEFLGLPQELIGRKQKITDEEKEMPATVLNF